MTSLQNLIPAPSTKGLFMCRPASILLANFNTSGGFTNPSFISISKVFGDFVYGLIATSRFAGHDEPFCFNLLTNAFVTVTGVTSANTPLTQPINGEWTPPQAAAVGSKLVFTHPGFTTAPNWFGYFDLTNPVAPAWNAGDCTGASFSGFTVTPTGVAQFNGRAYFIYNLPAQPAVIFSNVNDPLTNSATAVVPVITFGDNAKLTAIAGLPLSNQLGGIIQSLMVFKDASNIYQITGDASTNNLTVNTLNVPTGTLAPASVVPTPKGLGFISPDGFRLIDWDARVSDPIGMDGSGVTLPFIYANTPSRMWASSNGEVYRISVQNSLVVQTTLAVKATAAGVVGTNTVMIDAIVGLQVGLPIINSSALASIPSNTVITAINSITRTLTLSQNILAPGISIGDTLVVTTEQGLQEWWYDFGRQIWTGPHTSVMANISPYHTTFIGALRGIPALLWRTDYLQTTTSTFVENGNQMTWTHRTVLLPDTDLMTNAVTTQTTLDIAVSGLGDNITINARDQNDAVLSSALITSPGGGAFWGQANWGAFNWSGGTTALVPRIIPWPIPINFTRVAFEAKAASAPSVRLGSFHLRYKVLRFLVDLNSSLPVVIPPGPFIIGYSQLGGQDVLG